MTNDSPKKKVLFLCTGNSCRSQMAEAWTRHLHGRVLEAHSAGTEPKGSIDPMATQVMAEVGVDMKGQTSKHVDDLHGIPFDVVVTVCDAANEACPVFPGAAKVLHAGFDDPPALAARAGNKQEALAVYRRVRDEIRRFVESLTARLSTSE
jgi:arsenate reductase